VALEPGLGVEPSHPHIQRRLAGIVVGVGDAELGVLEHRGIELDHVDVVLWCPPSGARTTSRHDRPAAAGMRERERLRSAGSATLARLVVPVAPVAPLPPLP